MELFEVIIIGLIAGSATAVGGILSFILPIYEERWLRLILGFAGGVMTGLSLFQLMPEGYFFAGSLFPVGFGFSVGIIIMALLSFIIGTEHTVDMNNTEEWKHIGIFICISLALHNFPEGIAVGVGFAGHSSLGFMIAFAMLLHNIPEGLSIGMPMRKSGSGFFKILILTLGAGMMMPIGSVIGWIFGNISLSALGWAMGLAAGAMIFVAFTKLFSYHGYWNNLGAFCGILLTFLIA